jgi:hypothetical protein
MELDARVSPEDGVLVEAPCSLAGLSCLGV